MHARLMRHTQFRALAVTYGCSEIVDWLTTVALAVVVYDVTNSALATTVLFVAAKFVPAFIAPACTARVDGILPRRSLPALYLVQAAAFAGMALTSTNLPGLVALAAVAGAAALVSRALVRASVPAVLPDPEDLRAGNALLNVVFSTAFAAGPAVAGGIVAAAGAELSLAAGAGLLAGMAAFVALSSLPALATADEEAGDGWWSKLARAVSHVRHEPLLARLFGAQAVLLALFTMIPPIEVVYARHDLGTSPAGLGALMAAWGLGAVAGSAVFTKISRQGTFPLILGASAAIGVSYFGMGVAGSLPLACALAVVGGVGNGMQWVAFVTAVQERTPAALQARAMALVESLGAAVPGLGFVLGGVIAAAASARVTYAVAGIGVLACVGLVCVVARGLPRGQAQPAAV
jgi:predicted MFS family arabinose efflux permease